MSEVIFFTSLIYFNCSEYIISELLFCLQRIEFEHISFSQDTSTEVKKNDLLKRILTKSLGVDRLYSMQMSVFQFKMLHRHHIIITIIVITISLNYLIFANTPPQLLHTIQKGNWIVYNIFIKRESPVS